MTEGTYGADRTGQAGVDVAQQFPPMHVVTRLGRVIQQLRSFGELHAGELEALAVELDTVRVADSAELDTASAADSAARLRVYRDVQRDEAQMVVDELVDIQADMAAAAQGELTATEPALTANGQSDRAISSPSDQAISSAKSNDPAINSPKRARWLAEQAAEEERRRQPLSRRDFFGGGAKPDE